MILQRLSITNFKNIAEAGLDFSPKINCFLGNNGMGKSNLLDALYYLSLCRSFTGVADAALVRRGEEFTALNGRYIRRDMAEEVAAAIAPGRRKTLRRNGKPYQRMADHLGVFPVVLLSPADMELGAGEPAERRRFIDQVTAQADSRYYDALVRYNGALEQRNRMLRDGRDEPGLYEALEIQLEMAAEYIVHRRAENVAALQEIFTPFYNAVADNGEEALISYTPADYTAEGGLAAHLAAMRRRDLALRHTASGPHRDDILFSIDGLPVRRTASQGQAKTFTTALRFAQYELLHKQLGIKPLLLLDDIFDKLDASRVENIIKLVGSTGSFGQIFITDTNRRHLDETVATLGSTDDYSLWGVERGVFTPIDL